MATRSCQWRRARAMTDETEQRKAQTRATFNRLAADYDAAGVGCFAYFGRQLVQDVGVKRGQSVLDVATGRGAILLPAAELVGPEGRVVGIDLAEAMVEASRLEIAARGVAADVRVMDAEQLEFADAAFDRVLCGFGLMFFPHLDTALTEMRRVLKPAGRIGASTWRVSQTDDLAAVLDELAVGGTRPPGWITDSAELAHVLAEADFVDVDVRIETTTFRYDDLEQYWHNALGTGERRRLATLDPDQTEHVRLALAQRLRPHQRPTGLYVEASALFALAGR
jgi:ubiquinone/menaquinone biosynthesis C-methylase UbiE